MAEDIADPRLRRHVAERLRPHPYRTYVERFPDNGGRRWTLPHTFLRCGGDGWDEEPGVTALRTDSRWRFEDLPLNHLGLLYAPHVVADALHAVSG